MKHVIGMAAAGALAVLVGASAAFADMTAAESQRAEAACAAAAAEALNTSVDTLDVDVRSQRTRARVVRYDLRVTPEGAQTQNVACVYSRKSEVVTSVTVKN